jgi:hypothetical protein
VEINRPVCDLSLRPHATPPKPPRFVEPVQFGHFEAQEGRSLCWGKGGLCERGDDLLCAEDAVMGERCRVARLVVFGTKSLDVPSLELKQLVGQAWHERNGIEGLGAFTDVDCHAPAHVNRLTYINNDIVSI